MREMKLDLLPDEPVVLALHNAKMLFDDRSVEDAEAAPRRHLTMIIVTRLRLSRSIMTIEWQGMALQRADVRLRQPNGLELSCAAAQAMLDSLSRPLAGEPPRPFRTPAGSAAASCSAAHVLSLGYP